MKESNAQPELLGELEMSAGKLAAAFLSMAMSIACAGLAAQDVPKTDAQPSGQKVKLKIGKAVISKDAIGIFGGASPRVVIKVNKDAVYDSSVNHPKAKGAEYDFNENVEFSIPLNACVTVKFVNSGLLLDSVLLDLSSVRNYDSELFYGNLSDGKGSSVEISKVVPQAGSYTVELSSSYICPDDARRCGAELAAEDASKRLAEITKNIYDAYQKGQDWKDTSAALADEAKKCALGMDKLDHRVIVKCKGATVFDSWKLTPPIRPQGLKAEWAASFTFDWVPGDKVEVSFKDADLNGDDVIFSVSSTAKDSVMLLDGTLFGPMTSSGCSFATFKLK